MLLQPGIEVEVRFSGFVILVLSVQPYRVLFNISIDQHSSEDSKERNPGTYPTKIVQAQNQVPRIRELVHHEESILKMSVYIWEIEQDVSIGFAFRRFHNVGFNVANGGYAASRVASVEVALDAAVAGRLG